MAWRSHGHDQASLVDALARNGLVSAPAAERALRRVDRAVFCANGARPYEDAPQRTVFSGATISAPHMHAQCLGLLAACVSRAAAADGRRVSILDVGCGTGYLLAALAHLAHEAAAEHATTTTTNPVRVDVVGIERLAPLAEAARGLLSATDAATTPHLLLPRGATATIVEGDGHVGWPQGAPYHAIHVGAAVSGGVPPALLQQLAPGGALVVPLVDEDEEEEGGGDGKASSAAQALWLFEKSADGATVQRTRVMPVVYVPLVKEEVSAEVGVAAGVAARRRGN
jgi:protein-L-isoaspartate(D-aspartate) O-methyltransferase